MATLKANKDKARFISNIISQDELDGDWVDHEVVTKYKLPEIAIDASTTESLLISPTEITTGDKLKVLDGANMVERTAGTVTTTTTGGVDASTSENYIESGHNNTNNGSNAFDNNTSTSWYAKDYVAAPLCWIGQSGLTNKISSIVIVQGVYYFKSVVIEHLVGTTWVEIQQFNTGRASTLTITNPYTPESTYSLRVRGLTSDGASTIAAIVFELEFISALKYQAPITATTNIPTKAYFNKTIDTTLSAEDIGSTNSTAIIGLTVNSATSTTANITLASGTMTTANSVVLNGKQFTPLTAVLASGTTYNITFDDIGFTPDEGYIFLAGSTDIVPIVASDTFDGSDTFTKTYNTVTKTARDVEYGFVADTDVEVVQLNINQNMEP